MREKDKGLMKVLDSDIAIIEVLHDTLLSLPYISIDDAKLKRARGLTRKMYKIIDNNPSYNLGDLYGGDVY